MATEKNTKQLTPWEQWEQSQRMRRIKGPSTGQRIVDFIRQGCLAVLALLLLLLAFSFVMGRGFLDVNPF